MKTAALTDWHTMLRDEAALLSMPGAHHKALLKRAYAMHRVHLIDAEDLSELLEFSDAALLFAIESSLDIDTDQ